MDFDLIREVVVPNETKIVLLVMDGLGGLPHPKTRRTELETGDIPHLDRLAEDGICGLVQHVVWEQPSPKRSTEVPVYDLAEVV